MRIRLLVLAAFVALPAALLLPAAGLAVGRISEQPELADYDVRSGQIAPSAQQRALARGLRASVSWNRFGTPASLTRHGGYLARGIRAATPAEAARTWLRANRALFRLGPAGGLALESDTSLAFGRAHAVNFRQVFEGVRAAESGLVTVGLTGSKARGWNVAYASSSLTRDSALAGRVAVTAAQAWVGAARSVGKRVSILNVRAAKRAYGWETLSVRGFAELQRVKLVAFPTVRTGVVPAYESLVVDREAATAYRVFSDARDGSLLARQSLVDNLAAKQAVDTFTFSGEVPAADAACGPMHGPFAVGAGVRALDGFAAATVPTNDVVLKLFKDGALVLEADTLFSPEQVHYEPAGGVPAGDYTVQVCDFDDTANTVWAEPRTYTGTFTIDDTPAPPKYLARWHAFPSNPPLSLLAADPWNNPSTDTRELWCWRGGDAGDCDRVVGNLASRGPWDHDHKLNSSTFTTAGNNARSATSWTHALVPSPPQFRPQSSGRDYSFPWTNDWFTRDCNPGTPVPGAIWDDAAATVNLFVAHNRMHDWAYFLGFTEENFNGQDYNFGLTERRQENDPIIGDVQSGALVGARDNANMITLPDGVASITNMYFWQPLAASFYSPCVDGDYDMGVIAHEYGHMIENRMIGKGANRTGFHAGAMGESHADLMAAEYLNENGFVPTADENPFAVGSYATGNKVRAIRNYAMSFPSSGGVPEPGQQLNIDALNFGAMGYDVTGPQVHADGEIWSATNFSIRQALVQKYNGPYPAGDADLQRQCAGGQLPPQNCPGNRRWIQLVFDAYLLMPTNPSMLQARDAILAADLMRFGGANQTELWLAFAQRGFGRNATSSNAAVNSDTDPMPDFEPVGTTPATVTFVAQTVTGTPLDARIFVGHYEGRVSPIADTNPATPAPGAPASVINLDDAAKIAPGTYELVATAPGYGHVRFRQSFSSGQDKTITIRFAPNWASAAQGASASGDGTSLGNLIDDTEATNWTAPGTVTSGNLSVDGKRVTVDLGGTAAVRIKTVQVSAMLGPGPPAQNRFTALRQFEIWTCNATTGADCSSDAGYTKALTSPANAFPGDPPRPVAPQLVLRSFEVQGNVRATHVRLVVKTSQCTGTPEFQGEQDADTAFTTDCDSNVPAGSSRSFVRAAELQVFSDSPLVTPLG